MGTQILGGKNLLMAGKQVTISTVNSILKNQFSFPSVKICLDGLSHDATLSVSLPTFSPIYKSVKSPYSLSLFSAKIAFPEFPFSTLSVFKRWKSTTFRIGLMGNKIIKGFLHSI